MKNAFIPALRLLLVMTLLTGAIYPLAVTGIATALFKDKATGSQVRVGQNVVGSELLAQDFHSDKYFHARPSACAYATVPSGASNQGPTSAALKDSVESRRAAFRKSNMLRESDSVPTEMLFASGSGLDPHISPGSARLQVNRVATARGMDAAHRASLQRLVEESVDSPQFGVFGQPRVNVLLLNIKMDAMTQ